ncbi:FAD-dependent oxidoreductase [Microcoleus sp. B4-C1]|uniref:FAD-dependent oxidoreductase n=1 Tax=Microcoleus sp. B4-C1 TaxID=2818660 RepID=UPI002FD5BFB8
MTQNYDVIVIGGGPMGLCSAYNCAKAGKRVLLLERFNLFNQSGSSNDLVRMFRTMYTEDYMADLAYQTINLWKELESDAAEQLILMTGLLNFGDPDYQMGPEGNLTDPIKNLKRLGMPYRELTAQKIMEEYPFRNLPSNFIGLFAPDNGCINVPLVLRSLYRLALVYGAKIVSHTSVKELAVQEESVTVVATLNSNLEIEKFHAKKCIITAGAYTNDILESVGLSIELKIWEMVYEYYATNPSPNGTLFPSMWFQFKEDTGKDPPKSNLFYGFPSVPWAPPNLCRIAVDNAVNIIANPKDRRIVPSENDLTITAEFVKHHCIGVDDRPNYCGTCLQTNTVDNNFVLDYLPEQVGTGHKNVAIFTAGWGFKFVPLIGRILKELVIDGHTEYDISHFKITRKGIIGAPSKYQTVLRSGGSSHHQDVY